MHTPELYYLIDYEVLAHWICCDGTKDGTGVTLQTQSFTVKDCVLLISILTYKFDINCSLFMQRNCPVVHISGTSMRMLQPKIMPYIVDSMKYKLHVFKNKKKNTNI